MNDAFRLALTLTGMIGIIAIGYVLLLVLLSVSWLLGVLLTLPLFFGCSYAMFSWIDWCMNYE